jgi:heme oxygenase
MTAQMSLRAATLANHAEVDTIFSCFDLSKPSGYRGFLRGQAAACMPIERAIDKASPEAALNWPSRRRALLLQADLVDIDDAPIDEIAPPDFPSAQAVLGGIYVLEGSRLGGAFLRRRVASDVPRRFLDAETEPGGWRNLLALLDERLGHQMDLDTAVIAARLVFDCFASAGRHELSRVEAAGDGSAG